MIHHRVGKECGMKTLSIPYDEGLLVLMGTPPEAFEQEARFLLALKLFELRRISAGKAAELSGLGKAEFLFKTSQLRIPVVDLDDDQLDAEFQHA
jgi:predicted HTH domain antitoxin